MSKESLNWLNQNVLIGNTAQRGTAWHYRAAEQGTESNHYEGPIPLADVERRLFHWTAESRRVAVEVPADSMVDATHLSEDGLPMKWVVQPERQGIVRSDSEDGQAMGIFKNGYTAHQYQQWLVENVATILDDELSVSAAGLLRGGAQAWVEVSVPETLHTPEGVDFRPNLLAVTSFDGSMATKYKRTVNLTVCDNTLAVALGERGQVFRVKHSRNSLDRIADVREALNIVYTMADDFAAQVKQLVEAEVTNRQFDKIVEQLAPIPETMTAGRKTQALTKRDQLQQLWAHDERVTPWTGTAFGVVQTVNTFEHHVKHVRGADRVVRNMEKAARGEFEALDLETIRLVGAVTENANLLVGA